MLKLRLRAALTVTLFALLTSASAACQRSTPVTFNTPAQRADQALQDFAHKTGCVITVQPALLSGARVSALPGTHKPAEALDRLLKHSGLVFTDDRDGYVVTRWTR